MKAVKFDIIVERGGFRLESSCRLLPGIYGLLGASGSGKTTLLHALSGLVKPSAGSITFNESEIFNSTKKVNLATHKRNVGYVFQEGRLFPHLNARQNLLFSKNSKLSGTAYFNEIVELLHIGDELGKMPSELSGGQKQRIAVGRALLSDPKILLLDEPFSALDKNLKKQIIFYLDAIFNRLQIPVIVVSHELRDILLLTQNLILIKNGKTSGPATYLEQIKNGELLNFNGQVTSFYNVYEVELQKNPDKYDSLVSLSQPFQHVSLSVESLYHQFSPNNKSKITIRASDVAISLHKIDDISIRNQLPGKVERIIPYHHHFLIIVDCGIPVISRITTEAFNQLTIREGKDVFCLFKSIAVESL